MVLYEPNSRPDHARRASHLNRHACQVGLVTVNALRIKRGKKNTTSFVTT